MAAVFRKVLWSLSFGQGKSVESIAHRSTCNHTHKRSLVMPSTHAWQCIFWPPASPDSRGCTERAHTNPQKLAPPPRKLPAIQYT